MKSLSIHAFTTAIFLCIFFLLPVENITAQTNVIMQHNNLRRTGWDSRETVLTKTNVSGGNFGKIFTRTVDDQIYALHLL